VRLSRSTTLFVRLLLLSLAASALQGAVIVTLSIQPNTLSDGQTALPMPEPMLKDFRSYLASHISQAEVSALKFVGEPLVVNPQAMQHCCL